MIYLYASSSNNITFIPSSSISSGESVRAVFVDGFTEDSSSFTFPVTSLGNWVKGTIILPTNLQLEGGTYDVTFQSIVLGASQVWGTSTQVYGTSQVIWSVGTIDNTFVNQATTKAYVSESVSRTEFSSTNENAAYIVFNG
jgi:hypothetical protein